MSGARCACGSNMGWAAGSGRFCLNDDCPEPMPAPPEESVLECRDRMPPTRWFGIPGLSVKDAFAAKRAADGWDAAEYERNNPLREIR